MNQVQKQNRTKKITKKRHKKRNKIKGQAKIWEIFEKDES